MSNTVSMLGKYEENSFAIWQKAGLPTILPPNMLTAFRVSKNNNTERFLR
jgi:hypothetical protein